MNTACCPPVTIPIDLLISAHWGSCDVQQGETPEDYASRHEEAQIVIGWDCGTEPDVSVMLVWFADGSLALREVPAHDYCRTEPTEETYD